MSWTGWVEYGGNEIVNVARTQAYAAQAPWFRPAYHADGLADLLGDDPYVDPLSDDADWTDPDVPESKDFWGCYPLDIVGLDNSTVTAPVTESTIDGGLVGASRAGTKAVVFNVVLLGATEAAVDYGIRWLRSALAGDPCVDVGGGCARSNLCYLPAPPCGNGPMCGSAACVDPTERHLRRVGLTTGPNVTSKRRTADGGCVLTCTFTLVAGTPFEWGVETPLIHRFGSGVNPYPGGVTPPGGSWNDGSGVTRSDPDCAVPTFQPVFDPLCPNPIPPPNAPDVQLSCFNWPASFTRRKFVIPESYIPLWTSAAPIFKIQAKTEVRVMRLRFYADVLETGSADTDPCSYCGDIVFSYIPAKSTLVFDCTDQTVSVVTGAVTRRADSLVFATDGTPFEWPELSCGSPYIVVVDMPASQVPPLIDMSLTAKAN